MATTSAHSESAAASRIDPDTSVGTVRLTVTDLDRSRAFYEQVIGLRSIELDDGTLALGAAGEPPLIELRGDSAAPRPEPPSAGLVSPRDSRADAPGSGVRTGAARRGAVSARRRVRPSGQRGAVPVRPGRQRDRDLPRSSARRLAARRRPASDVDVAARPRRRDRRASRGDRAPGQCPLRYQDRARTPPGFRPERGRSASTTACSGST